MDTPLGDAKDDEGRTPHAGLAADGLDSSRANAREYRPICQQQARPPDLTTKHGYLVRNTRISPVCGLKLRAAVHAMPQPPEDEKQSYRHNRRYARRPPSSDAATHRVDDRFGTHTLCTQSSERVTVFVVCVVKSEFTLHVLADYFLFIVNFVILVLLAGMTGCGILLSCQDVGESF
jgi:hypothetical protein